MLVPLLLVTKPNLMKSHLQYHKKKIIVSYKHVLAVKKKNHCFSRFALVKFNPTPPHPSDMSRMCLRCCCSNSRIASRPLRNHDKKIIIIKVPAVYISYVRHKHRTYYLSHPSSRDKEHTSSHSLRDIQPQGRASMKKKEDLKIRI